MRGSVNADQQDSEYTWRTPGNLAGRLEVPVDGAWERLYAGPKRRAMLDRSFSSANVIAGAAIGLVGPLLSGKSQIALALADLRNLRAVYATDQTDQQAFTPAPGLCVIIDPVSAYDPRDVAACVEFYRSTSPVLLIDRNLDAITQIPGVAQIIKLKLPSSAAIGAYVQELLDGASKQRSYQHTLTAYDFEQIGQAMEGLSLPQVNQITLDAALSRLMDGQPIDRRAFDSALSAYMTIRQSANEAAYTGARR